MSNLIEVVFEGVAKGCVMQLLALLIQSAEKLTGIQCSENIVLLVNDELSEEALNQLLNFNGDVSVLFNLQDVKLGSIVLPSVQLRLVKYGSDYDIDFNFDYNELENVSMTTLINSLHSKAKTLASEFDITSFYGGMEPASDEDTRYFTDEEKGPLTA